jgi:5'-nucleotidase
MTRLAILVLLAACSGWAGARDEASQIAVKILAINDFHGHLQPSPEPVRVAGAPLRAGGAAQVATLVERLRAAHPHVAFVSAGDLVGASPLISAFFDDEPAIEAMNLMGLDFNGVGNHEFDRGVAHLRRLQQGGCPPGGCKSRLAFAGAKFRMLAANVFLRATGEPLFAPYAVKEYAGVKVGFIGLTLRQTPLIVSPRAIEGLEFRDEAQTVDELAARLKGEGVAAIIVLIHQGGVTSGGHNECQDLRGAILDIARRLHEAVDVIVSAHTHQAYICRLGGRLVTSAGAYGRFVTEIDLKIDPERRGVIAATALNHVVVAELPPNSAQAALVERYAKLAEPLERVVGRVAGPFPRAVNDDGESPLGQLIADSHLEATRAAGAMVAFMNPGGIRAPLERKGNGEIVFTDVYAVYPFNNTLVTMTLTGVQILRLLEQQWQGQSATILQVSKGFSYAWDPARPPGSRVLRDSVMIDGAPLQPDGRYRVSVNSFNAEGGDGLNAFLEGVERTAGVASRDALIRYIQERSPVAPASERRVRKIAKED